ncbi:MAG: 16S rRNA (guanine(966)-N(2))-methyltransferase RsmD [Terriglobia bacterium]
MRVIAGKFKSRKLKTLTGEHLRPTSDPLRETLFNVLGARVVGSLFADGYAGSGAVGIEALSRGAGKVFFLENHRPATAVIRGNLASLGVFNGFEILPTDVVAGLERLRHRGIALNFVFLDPPYAAESEYERALTYLGTGIVLQPAGHAIVEHSKRTALPERVARLVLARTLRQGDSVLSFYWLGD